MIKRDTVRETVLSCGDKNILLELATGAGKTKIALEFLNKRTKGSILIVVPRLVLIDNWKNELDKWGFDDMLSRITFVTYVSFPKKAGKWNAIVYDECHHLSERCREALCAFQADYNILLSATVGRNLKREIRILFPYLRTFIISTRDAIEDSVLPDPKVFLLPLKLDNTMVDHTIIRNKGKGNRISIPYQQKWKYKGYRGEVHIKCTQQQYYDDLSSMILWYKNKIHIPAMKNLYLHHCGERLKWLSQQKTSMVYYILSKLTSERTLTFCSSIVQTETLGKYCINSKNKESENYLNMFNNGEISHITCVNMLDEGVNLSSCRIGVYANLNSSERITKQRLGRLLRHPDPILIIPYFVYTRDEEIVSKMCEDYNPELINKITNIEELWQKINQ